MEKMLVNLFVVIVFIIVALCLYYVFRSIYRYNLKIKAENLERDINREREIFQQYLKIKVNYFNSIANLKNDLANSHLRTQTLEEGQKLIEFTKQHAKYESVILYDEGNLINDIPGRTDPLFIMRCVFV